MKRNPGCLARQHSDQMICPQCGLVWDLNDPEPPDCNEVKMPVAKTRPKLQPNVESTTTQRTHR